MCAYAGVPVTLLSHFSSRISGQLPWGPERVPPSLGSVQSETFFSFNNGLPHMLLRWFSGSGQLLNGASKWHFIQDAIPVCVKEPRRWPLEYLSRLLPCEVGDLGCTNRPFADPSVGQ